MMVDILMPLADGQRIMPAVLQGIAMQTVPCRLMVISRPQDQEDRYNSICLCRNLLKAYTRDRYSVLLDSDVVFFSDHDVEDMLAYMEGHPDCPAVALNTKPLTPKPDRHIPVACVCVRNDALQRVWWKHEPHRCECESLPGLSYLDNRQLTEVPYGC